MFELFWGILNLVLLIGLIIYLIKVIKLIHKEFGIISAIFLIFIFIISFTPLKDKMSDSEFKIAEAHQGIYENTKLKRVLLTDNSLNKTFVNLKFSEDNKLLKASLNRSGLVAFTGVTPNILVTEKLGENNIKYGVFYSKNWYLIGLEVYTETFEIQKEIFL